jgi:hypothetical protein
VELAEAGGVQEGVEPAAEPRLGAEIQPEAGTITMEALAAPPSEKRPMIAHSPNRSQNFRRLIQTRCCSFVKVESGASESSIILAPAAQWMTRAVQTITRMQAALARAFAIAAHRVSPDSPQLLQLAARERRRAAEQAEPAAR